jgi:hypothetical protein
MQVPLIVLSQEYVRGLHSTAAAMDCEITKRTMYAIRIIVQIRMIPGAKIR